MNFRLERTWRACVFKYTACFLAMAWQEMFPKGSWVGGMIPTPWWVVGADWIVKTLSSWTDWPVSTFAVRCFRKFSGLAGGLRPSWRSQVLSKGAFCSQNFPSSLRFLVAMRRDSLSLSHSPFRDALLQSHANSHQAKQSLSETFKIVSQKKNFYFLLVSCLPQRFCRSGRRLC